MPIKQKRPSKKVNSAAVAAVITALLLCAPFVYSNEGSIAELTETQQGQLEAAQQAFAAGAWEDALRLYQAVAAAAPDRPLVHIGVADSAVRLQDYDTAIDAYNRALARLSAYPQGDRTRHQLQITLQAKLAAAYHRDKQLDAADTWFQTAVKGAGDAAPVAWYVALGQIATERGNLEEARRYYIVAVQLDPETTAAYNNLGHVLLKLNRLDEADAVFRAALAQDSTLASAAFGRGEAHARRRQHADAERFYRRAIKHAPNEPIFHKSLAALLRDIGNTAAAAAAERHYRRTLADRYREQAHRRIEEGDLQRAAAALQKAIETDSTRIAALKDYAYVQMRLRNLHAARQSYQQVLVVQPTSRQALLHLGLIAAELGDKDAAAAHYDTLIRHDPDFMESYVQLANLHEANNDLDAAAAALTAGLQHEPTWAPGYLWRGKIYQKQHRGDRAETDFRQAIRLAPDVPFPKAALARLLATENRALKEALPFAAAAVEAAPHPEHRATLALIYYRLNRHTEARLEIAAALAEAPENRYLLRVQAEILKVDR